MRILLLKTDWIAANWSEQILWGVAIIASLLLLVFTVYSFFSEEPESDSNSNQRKSLKLDAHTVLIFFAVLGWSAAIAAHFEYTFAQAILLGALVGGVLAFLSTIYRLPFWTSSQNSRPILDSTGKVLQPIPPHRAGMGKIHLDMRHLPTSVNAVTHGRELPVGAPVRVVGMIDKKTLLVEPIEEDQDHPYPGTTEF
ncbi:MAG: NfeD family protein [Saprospiraceae bacterium]|nr:NfeD family protein [Saprospiraceae bacterium]